MSVRRTAEENTERLLAKRNVVGVGEGEGKVVVFVTTKEPLWALATHDVVDTQLPATDDDEIIPTDVIEVGHIKALGLEPGASIGLRGYGWTGTCGCLVTADGKLGLLSNNHVIGNNNLAPVGAEVIHPGPLDGAYREVVATLHETAPIEFSENANNQMDAAVATITNNLAVIGNVGITGVFESQLVVDDPLVKVGRTSGVTKGSVVALNSTITVDYGSSGVARFIGQVVTTMMLHPGDSGSVAITPSWKVAALGFAGSDLTSIFTPIGVVFDRLKLSLPQHPESPEPQPGCLPKWLRGVWSPA